MKLDKTDLILLSCEFIPGSLLILSYPSYKFFAIHPNIFLGLGIFALLISILSMSELLRRKLNKK